MTEIDRPDIDKQILLGLENIMIDGPLLLGLERPVEESGVLWVAVRIATASSIELLGRQLIH